jgi:hypothetical protein
MLLGTVCHVALVEVHDGKTEPAEEFGGVRVPQRNAARRICGVDKNLGLLKNLWVTVGSFLIGQL